MSVAFDSDVTLTVEVAFGADGPFDTTLTWTDISADVRGFNIDRGKLGGIDNGLLAAGPGLSGKVSASRLRMRLDNTAGAYDPLYTTGANYPNVVPGVPCRIKATYSTVDYWLFAGRIDRWPVTWRGKNSEVQVEGIDNLGLLLSTPDDQSEVQELAGTRIGNILDTAGWPTGVANRNIATGTYQMIANAPECVNCLDSINQVVDSEIGEFWIAPDSNGIGKATFKGNGYRAGLSSSATFGSGVGEIPFRDDIEVSLDSWAVVNDVNVTGPSGSGLSVDSLSVTDNGTHAGSVFEGLLPNDTDAGTIASGYTSLLADPTTAVRRMVVDPRRSPTDWGTLLGLDLSDKVTVKIRPDTYTATHTLTQYVEAIGMEADVSRSWLITYQLSGIG